MTEIIGDYALFQNNIIGTGTFSTVFLGENIINRKDVAIKRINKDESNNIGTPMSLRSHRKRINNEIQIARVLMKNPHSNIVSYYDVIEKNNYVYLIMEYYSQGNLHDFIKGPMKEHYVCNYFLQIIEGLKHLIQHNISHKDIKPHNILVSNDRKILKIADFGLANLYKKKNSKIKVTCGSPLYMAPEILNGISGVNDVDSNIWTVGIILFQLLYGYHPYEYCKSIDQLVIGVCGDDLILPPLNNTNVNVSKECLNLLKQLLNCNPYKRISWIELIKHNWLQRWEFIDKNENINSSYKTELNDNTNKNDDNLQFSIDF